MLQYDWRAQKNNNFVISSFFEKNKIDNFLLTLVKKQICNIKMIEEFGEIIISINEYKIITFQLEEKPEWTLFDNKNKLYYFLENDVIAKMNIKDEAKNGNI